MKRLFFLIYIICVAAVAWGQVEVTQEDSAMVVQLLKKARSERAGEQRMIYFGLQLLGIPYVAHTLEEGSKEHLIVNLHGLDCTTFVETVTALSLCDSHDERRFEDYCRWLEKIRYRNGRMGDYTSRLHYFTWWGEDNERLGIVKRVEDEGKVFTAKQTIDIDYMSRNSQLYKHLKNNPQFVKKVAELERASKGEQYLYIPKELLNKPQTSALGVVHDGDIVSMLTAKTGLDTQHIGIAYWKAGRLHLMHASSVKKQVVMDSRTFYDYLQSWKPITGIRVYRVEGL